MKTVAEVFAARVGIDWADTKHDICLQVDGQSEVEFSQIPHTVEAVHGWADALAERFDNRPVAVAIELSKGPLVYLLEQHAHLVIFPINPASLARYRQTFTLSDAKDDPSDAHYALDLLTRHPERLAPLQAQSGALRALEQVLATRQMLRGDITRVSNRLSAALKNYYPQALELFRDKDTSVFCQFLTRWPTPAQGAKARTRTLERFFHQHNVRRRSVIERRISQIKALKPLTTDPAIVQPNVLQVQILVRQLMGLIEGRAQCEQQIKHLCGKCQDHHIFASFPGAGTVCSARLTSAFGEHRDRLPSAAHAQRAFGIAPVIERSGKSTWVHWRIKCDKQLRQSLVEWAAQTIPRSFWANAYYHQQRAKGSSHQAALRALAFKWTRILHRCWQDRTEYDESKYLQALKQRGSPLLKYIAEAA